MNSLSLLLYCLSLIQHHLLCINIVNKNGVFYCTNVGPNCNTTCTKEKSSDNETLNHRKDLPKEMVKGNLKGDIIFENH